MIFRATALAVLLATANSSVAGAQAVAGTVVSGTEPQAGVLVTSIDASGREHARTISTASGGFVLRAPAGAFRLSVARIGFQRWYSTDFASQGRDTLRVRLDVDNVPLLLPELTAVGATRCRSEVGDRASVLWEDARTALMAAGATIEAGVLAYTSHEVLRRLEADGSFLVDTLRVMHSRAQWPVEAIAPELLFEHGFVQQRGDPDDLTYYGIDLAVLFDPGFLERYCIRAVEGPAGSGLTGIGFSPAGKTPPTAIRGTLWLDAASRRLRSLEFSYVGLPKWVPSDGAGGRLEFVELPDGRWLVVRWRMLAPVPRRTNVRTRVAAFAERDGGVVVAVDPGRDTVWSAPPLTGNQSPAKAVDAGKAPVVVKVQGVRTGAGKAKRVIALNQSSEPQVIRTLVVERCANVLERCARYPVAVRLAPGERRALMTLSPWIASRPWSFAARVELDGEPAG